MPLIDCEINLILAWFKNCVASNTAANQGTTLEITNTKLYVPVVTLSTEDNTKLLQQLKSQSIGENINQNQQHRLLTNI